MLVLGLDVGSTSCGWTLIDDEKEVVLACGVRIFPEGVDRDQQGGEQSKSQARRVSRGTRRQIARRSKRKREVRMALQSIGLLPANGEQLQQVLQMVPYPLRAKAVHEQLERFELGRVFFHLATRRGFLSNRKTDKDRDAKGMLEELDQLALTLNERDQTLGEYLSELDPHTEQVRGRHTRRSMFEEEFDAIWNKQCEFYPELLTERLKYGAVGRQEFPVSPRESRNGNSAVDQYGIHGLLFFQRKMYWPKSVVGQCELTDETEPDKRCKRKRCPKADRAAQKFRILQEVNNLKVLDEEAGTERRLTDEERSTVVDALLSTKQQTFAALRKKLGFTEEMIFNIERGGRDKLQGHETDAAMSSSKGIGKHWRTLPDDVKDRVVSICIHEASEEVALRNLVEECGLTPEEAQRASAVHLPEKYMHFCRDAILRLIPHLERGLLLMADDASNSALHAAGYLRPDERVVNEQQFLPPPPELPNPIVRQAMYEVRKVVNSVIREFRKPDRIHIELAREAKKSFDERQEIRFENSRRERHRREIADRLVKDGIKPTRASINRYLLWEEQGGDCIYCDKSISQAHLFAGDVDVDHILPRWRSLDDSLGNKVVCHRRCNDEKKDRTPREWLEHADPARYDQMLQRARKLAYGKRQRLQQLDIELENFVERQLRDTTYISRCVKEFLEGLGVPVVCPRGGMTKDLRHWWGLNNLLDKEKKGRKNRNDHRHHAVDAIVVALTNHARLHALANARGEKMPLPWDGFLQDARMAVLSVKVSHRSRRRISGSLHEATIYGPTNKPQQENNGDVPRPWAVGRVEEANTFVRRKSVTELKNGKHLVKVRDATIREILRQHLRKQGVDPDSKKAYPADAFKGDNTPEMPSGVPIKKVRMLEESKTFRRVSDRRDGQNVKPGNNHHIIYWAQGEGDQEKWSADVVTMWDAAKRARAGLPPVDRAPPNGRRFVMSLSINEMFEMVDGRGEIVLCVVRKMDQRSKRVYYKLHLDARPTEEINKDNLYLSPKGMVEKSARKVTVDPLGRIRWAND